MSKCKGIKEDYSDGVYRIWRDTTESDLEGEVWREVYNSQLYEVSNLGRVRVSLLADIKDKKLFYKGKIITQNRISSTRTYLRATLRGVSTSYNNGAVSSHRMVGKAFVEGETLERNQINHKDGNPANNHFTNLEWCTSRENKDHAIATGLQWYLRGEDRIEAKLTEKQVFEILHERFYNYKEIKELSKQYGMHPQYISLVVRGKRWAVQFEKFLKENKEHYDKVSRLLAKRNGNNQHLFDSRLKEILDAK